MKKVIAILLLGIFLTANTAFGQLLRLPTLFHHYLEHVEWDNYTFAEFLAAHYSGQIEHPDDQHGDHQKLPFKSGDFNTSHVVTDVLPQCLYLSEIIVEGVDTKTPIHDKDDYPNSYLSRIWQPPRI